MSVLSVPELDAKPWPTLGPQVCRFIEDNLVFGPGDLRGQPAKLDDEKRGLVYRMYEVYPRGHKKAGRRRFKRVGISLRKGSAKSEFAAWIAIVEAHPEGPVRCIGWDKKGNPIGGPVNDPYVPLMAYTEEQSEELCYGAALAILQDCELGKDFDLGLERIMRKDGAGKIIAVASAPNSADGARTTFQVFDESHRLALPRLKAAHRTMLANIPKRMVADAWSLEITTAPAPGENSVAEDTMRYAQQIAEGRISDPKLFFFHRQASDGHDLSTVKGVRAAVREASGPVAEWSDIDTIAEQWKDPTADKTYLERVWLNRLVQAAERAFDAKRWRALAKSSYRVTRGALITLGFDGSRFHDATALVGTEVETGFQFVLGLWERPEGLPAWEVPRLEVDECVAGAFEDYEVWRLYADPPFWEETVSVWSGKYGAERVIEWWTNRQRPMAYAIQAYVNAMTEGSLSNDGHEGMARHIGNAHKRRIGSRDPQGADLFTIQKERKDSPHKIDCGMAGALSWEARRDALAAGAEPEGPSVYEGRGLVTL